MNKVQLYREHKLAFNSWRAAKERCYNTKYRAYHRYGGRGISMCERWLDSANGFANFLEDMGDRPVGTTLDRIDNDGDYSPNNCRWSTQYEQLANSTKKTRAKITSEEFEEFSIVSLALVYKRIRNGWDKMDALTTPTKTVYEQLHERAMRKHRTCPYCGEKCPTKRSRFCNEKHYFAWRKENPSHY